ncbi:FecR family protein [Ochrovirga pacifica]|uniref:FecR family protein n=1 Tax=Ochrovirga pacifica TaxID=1042376 RepID=UPI0002558B34|nr:FecR domain-containing protein [Ochrovirga pacifica]
MIELSNKERKCIRYLTNEMSKSDAAVFEIELSIDNELNSILNTYKEIWNHYPEDTDSEKKVRKKYLFKKLRIRKNKKTMTVLASFLLIFSVLSVSKLLNTAKATYTNVVSTTKGEVKIIYLNDSTKIHLNALSQIKYPNKFNNRREVYLEGEAFFDVTHNKKMPFIVHTKDLDIEVLGTAFNVNTYTNNKSVSLQRGKVQVKTKNNNNYLELLPNEEVVYNIKSKHLIKRNFKTNQVLGWKENVLIFNNLPLKDAINQINSFYGVQFSISNAELQNKKITGAFKNQTIKQFIEAVEFIANVSIDTISDNQYQINQKK